jgi:hypothetical protein
MTPEERLVAEQAVLNLRALNKVCDAAPHGRVLAVAEDFAMNQGRELIRRTLEASLKRQAGEVEKKGRRPDAAPAENGERTVGAKRGKS